MATIDKNEIHCVDDAADSIQASKAPQMVKIDNFQVLGLAPEDADFYTNYPEEKRKRVLRKVDIRLVPMLAVLYLISHIDRANIGNAKIEGMVSDLGLNGVEWNVVLSVFFVPYILLEVPSNMLLKKVQTTIILPWYPHYQLGHHYDNDGCGEELCRPIDNQDSSWCIRSWFLSRRGLPLLLLVYAETPCYENLILLLRVGTVWGL